MFFRPTCLQFSLRTLLLSTFVAIVGMQSYRYAVQQRELSLLSEQFANEIDRVVKQCEKGPPRCAVLRLNSLIRTLEESRSFHDLPMRTRGPLASRLEAERFKQFALRDQQASINPKLANAFKRDDTNH